MVCSSSEQANDILALRAAAVHVTEAVHGVLLVTARVNELFWFAQVHITSLHHLLCDSVLKRCC